jgi:hypothetical protein
MYPRPGLRSRWMTTFNEPAMLVVTARYGKSSPLRNTQLANRRSACSTPFAWIVERARECPACGSVAETSAAPDMAHLVFRPIPWPLLDRHYTQIILNKPDQRRRLNLFEIQKSHYVQQSESVVKNRSSEEDFLTVTVLCRKHLAYIRSPGGKVGPPDRTSKRPLRAPKAEQPRHECLLLAMFSVSWLNLAKGRNGT